MLLLLLGSGWYLLAGRGGGTSASGPSPWGVIAAGKPGSAAPEVIKPSGPPATKMLNPSSQPQSVSLEDKVTVTVPGGVLKEARNLSITPLGTIPNPTAPGVKQLSAYDVSMGDLREFQGDLTIEIAVDPSRIGKDLLWLEYWDEVQQTWVMLPSEVDRQKKVVRARTRHLCPVSVASAEQVADYLGKQVAEGDKGKWYYANDYFVMSFNKDEVEKSTGPKTGWYEKPDPNVKPVRADMPRYAEDVWAFANNARQKYQSAGFRELPKFDENAWIYKNGTFIYLGGSGSPYRNKFTGNLSISLDCAGNPPLLNFTIAHELFHSIQGQYYTAAGMTARKWWIEATADYAADRVAMGGSNMMGGERINPRFLEKQLTYSSSVVRDAVAATGLISDDPHGYHEYTGAFFVDFLVRRKGGSFGEMFNKVAEYWSPDIEGVLDEYLRSKGSNLPDSYREFARYWLFDPQSPIYTRVGVKDLMAEAAEPGLPSSLAADQDEITASLSLDTRQSAKLWGLKVGAKGEAGKPATRKLRVESDGLAQVDVYTVKAGSSTQTRPSMAGGTSAGLAGKSMVDVEVGDGDTLYLIVYNLHAPAGIGASVRVSALDVFIQSVSPDRAWYDDEVTLKGKGFGDSQDKSRLTLFLAGKDTGLVVTPTAWSKTEIKFKVPRGVLDVDKSKEPSGDVDVQVTVGGPTVPAGGIASNRVRLSIGKAGPRIQGVSPAKASVGDEVTISGIGFGETQGASSVTFNKTVVASNLVTRDSIISWKDKEIRLKVPNNSWSGDLVVKVAGADSNKVSFEVDFVALLQKMTRLVANASGQMTYKNVAGGKETSTTDSRSFEVSFPVSASNMSFQGYSFKATGSDTNSDGTVISYSVEGVFDPSGGKLASATVSKSMKRPDYQDVVQYNVRNVPLMSSSQATSFYQLKGVEAGESPAEVKHTITWPSTGQTRTFVSGKWTNVSFTWSNR